MYLTARDVEASLAVIARRSAAESRLIIAYHSPSLFLWFAGLYLRRLGEPLRSTFKPNAMRALLAKYGFEVVRDEDTPTLGAALSPAIGQATQVAKHLRVVTADRRRTP